MKTKAVLTGNEAVARGAWEAGVGLGVGYPGTPSTEILENLALYEGPEVVWAVNEKVALEEAYGASIGGLRTLVTMKHVGLNVAADPLFTAAYMGVNGGMVIAVADDPGMHSSQNEQDNRWYALHAKVPMLEPSDSQECLLYTRLAFELSERYDVPVLLRLVTRTSHARGVVELSADCEYERVRYEYVRDPKKYMSLPANCRLRKQILEKNLAAVASDEAVKTLDVMDITGTDVGIITAGASYNYIREVFGDRYSVLKLGLVYPLNEGIIREFAGKVKEIYVVEELDPYLEMSIKALGIRCEGKKYITSFYELNPQIVADSLQKAGLVVPQMEAAVDEPLEVPARPPLLCAGCPHRGFFYAARREKVMLTGDIGCYALGGMPPLEAIDASICMGGGYTLALGLSLIAPEGEKVFGCMGDSTFYHSGITGAIEAVYNNRSIIPVVLDNRITAMTGHQENPGTGRLLNGEAAYEQQPEKLLQAVGYDRVLVVHAYELESLRKAIREAKEAADRVAIVVKTPCRLLKGVKPGVPRKVDAERCKKCKACLKLGCPAISLNPEGVPAIDPITCFGCGLCAQVCRNNAIDEVEEEE
ncbi:MAG: indolepyruvate ferredoxin oxidoreductase, alpha subunit [Clostridia bacterium]|nr:indolepyruvate ferredoxin oxidoreductase, alpha subunit [Clostridia bacterium]MDN5365282.1 indolepyruvate ferredoxin oxidoreductase, alpha subunit [Thermacetogenium sp.]MDN5376425.1 indolepyruvate ferredoxin oxidoreductase, alpha subunit [Thermacetogenium sp.]